MFNSVLGQRAWSPSLWYGLLLGQGSLIFLIFATFGLSQDGLIHTSLKPAEILYLTVAYDWFLFG